MKSLANFEEFVKLGIISKRSPEIPRATFLIKESKRKNDSLNWTLEKLGIADLNAHEIIESCYDILVYLVRAKLCLDGFNSGGEGSHEAEISYMRKLRFSEEDVNFMNQLRYFRNGIKYYGKVLDKEYAEQTVSFLQKVYPELIKKTEF